MSTAVALHIGYCSLCRPWHQQCIPVRGVMDGALIPIAGQASASWSSSSLFLQIFSRKSCRTAVRFCM